MSRRARTPRAFSAFVAIADAEGPLTRRDGLRSALFWVAIVAACAWFLLATWRPLIAGLGGLAMALLLAEWIRGRNLPEISSDLESARRQRLLESLNRTRRMVGLEAAIDPSTLQLLEECATRWEQIENMLAHPGWRMREPLRSDVQKAADEWMMQVVTAHLEGRASEPLSALDERLTRVLAALVDVERKSASLDGAGVEHGASVPDEQSALLALRAAISPLADPIPV